MPKRFRDHRTALIGELAADPDLAASYLNAALQDSEQIFLRALRDVAESHRIAVVAERAGLSRESLYRTLSEAGNPTFRTLQGILGAVGLTIKLESIADERDTAANSYASSETTIVADGEYPLPAHADD